MVDYIINLFNGLWHTSNSSKDYDEKYLKNEEMARLRKPIRVSNGSMLFLSYELLNKFDNIYDDVIKTGV
jgi:hypothetical protein